MERHPGQAACPLDPHFSTRSLNSSLSKTGSRVDTQNRRPYPYPLSQNLHGNAMHTPVQLTFEETLLWYPRAREWGGGGRGETPWLGMW